MCRRRKKDINSLYYGYKYIVYMVIAVYIESSPNCGYLQAVNIIWKSKTAAVSNMYGCEAD